ncbi:hypothetical protein COT47_04435 [Candidatus Woesearchaeota archaeon CG08_land_8_20_14_0_20_43_7]|nr:MAG: hypothetical protein COT47_04435 [Candidatus Woesearchaeota archaeon CG08_land_8_20_14_0_20_43_7]
MAKTVMVVDDDPEVNESITALLEGNGYATISANSGDDCLEMLKSMAPDLILLDIMMPGTPAKEIINKIKGMKIIFLSGVKMSEHQKSELLKGNIVDFIQKPFDIDDFTNKIKTILGDD